MMIMILEDDDHDTWRWWSWYLKMIIMLEEVISLDFTTKIFDSGMNAMLGNSRTAPAQLHAAPVETIMSRRTVIKCGSIDNRRETGRRKRGSTGLSLFFSSCQSQASSPRHPASETYIKAKNWKPILKVMSFRPSTFSLRPEAGRLEAWDWRCEVQGWRQDTWLNAQD